MYISAVITFIGSVSKAPAVMTSHAYTPRVWHANKLWYRYYSRTIFD